MVNDDPEEEVEDPELEAVGDAIQDVKVGGDKALEEERGLEEEEEVEIILEPPVAAAAGGTAMLGLRSGGAGGGRFKSE